MTPDRTKELLPVMQAHAEKKQVESRSKCFSTAVWVLDPFPTWDNNYDYRIAPWKLTNHIEGFRALVDGEKWHRHDFTEEMLPEGYRPLLLGEARKPKDEHLGYISKKWSEFHSWFHEKDIGNSADKDWVHVRTRRPLPEIKKPIPLEAKDILPGTVIRNVLWDKKRYVSLLEVFADGVKIYNGLRSEAILSYKNLAVDYMYHHPSFSEDENGELIWKPCYKYV